MKPHNRFGMSLAMAALAMSRGDLNWRPVMGPMCRPKILPKTPADLERLEKARLKRQRKEARKETHA